MILVVVRLWWCLCWVYMDAGEEHSMVCVRGEYVVSVIRAGHDGVGFDAGLWM